MATTIRPIKLYDGVKIAHKGKEMRLDYIPDIWEAFGWDIHNDEMAKACSVEITRSLVAFGYCDLADDNGVPIHIEIIPTKD